MLQFLVDTHEEEGDDGEFVDVVKDLKMSLNALSGHSSEQTMRMEGMELIACIFS